MSKFLFREMKSIVCGNLIGEGMSRKVYELLLNPNYVIKIEDNAKSFQNVAEWEMWQWVDGGPMAKWFAPCHMISNCGSMLIQSKVEPIRTNERPGKLPAFLCDFKRENFGMLKGKVVCCDYGTGLSSIRNVPKGMKKVEWRS